MNIEDRVRDLEIAAVHVSQLHGSAQQAHLSALERIHERAYKHLEPEYEPKTQPAPVAPEPVCVIRGVEYYEGDTVTIIQADGSFEAELVGYIEATESIVAVNDGMTVYACKDEIALYAAGPNRRTK